MKIRFVPNIEPLDFWWSLRGWTRRMFVNIHNFENIYFFSKFSWNHFLIFIIIFPHRHWSRFNSSVKWKRKHYWVKNFLKLFNPLILFLSSPRFRLFSHISFMSKRRLWEGLWFRVNSTSFLPPFGFSKSFFPH